MNGEHKTLELLSPCGDMESVRAAILYGADAVYLGGSEFGLRANAGFAADTLTEAVKYAHTHNVKVYLTCNVVANNSDIDRFPNFITTAAKTGIDAVIVSDLGVFDLVRTHTPQLPVHISTQAGVMNYATANMLCKLGAKRIILARETSLTEIARIRHEAPPELELEAFVHGAMCMGFSGRCLISSYLTDRDANRGKCAQPCRWKYAVVEETRQGEFFPVIEDDGGSYIFNSKDLCMLQHIGELAQSGVMSLKIEGRAKTAYYSAVVTGAYRAAIDAYEQGQELPDWVEREVYCVSHRPYSTGFYLDDKNASALQSYDNSGYIRDCDFVGVVDRCENGIVTLTQRNYFTVGDYLEVIQPGIAPAKLEIEQMHNSKGESVTIANHAVEELQVRCRDMKCELVSGALLRRVNRT